MTKSGNSLEERCLAPSKAKGGRYQNWGPKGNRRISRALPGSAVFPVAIHAEAVNLEGVTGCAVVEFAANFLFKAVDFRRKELDRTAASRTDHMVVAPAVVLMLEASLAIVELDFAGQAAFGEQLQRAVDGRHTNAGIAGLDQTMQFICREMISGFQERL